MKHLNLNTSNGAGCSAPVAGRRHYRGWFNLRVVLLALFTLSAFISLQAQCNLACIGTFNSPLQVSVNQTCEVTLVIDAVVQAPLQCPGPKNMIARDGLNNVVAFGVDEIFFDASPYIGAILSVEIEDINTNTICIGFIELMDYVNPVFEVSCADVVMGCMGDTSVASVGMPVAMDNCGSIESLTYTDIVTLGNCLTEIVTEVERTWVATDNSGNSVSCVQMIFLEKPTLDMVVFPNNITISCDNPDADPETVTGVPMIDGGSIMNGDICNLLTTFEDDTVYVCSNIEYQIVREWSVLDNCTDFFVMHQQIISIADETAPVLECPENLVVSTVPGECYGTVSLPIPELFDNCDADPDIFANTTYGAAGFGPHTQVPVGTHTVQYTGVDECGNTAGCSITVTVVDNQKPTAVCNDELVVSISTGGIGVVAAVSFDEGSNDNCNPQLFYKARRVMTGVCDGANGDDSPQAGYQEWFDNQVIFCCEEMEEESIMVLLHVYEVNPGQGPIDPSRELPGGDLFNHFNECTTLVTVQDQISPFFADCPDDVTIDCHDDYSDLSIFGNPVVIDNCTYNLETEVVENINNCGVGNIVRTFTATDLSGHTATCVQEITLINENPFSGDQIIWPPTYTTYECGAAVAPGDLPEEYQEPVFTGDQCSNLVYNYSDAIYTITMPACYKILRKWTVIDWCNFDEENPEQGGKFTHTQVIKVLDSDPPVIESCPENVTVAVDAQCGFGTVNMNPIVADDCSNSLTITNNSPYAYANGSNASGVYPLGTTQITFTVADHCGNASTCSVLITVEDRSAPSIICITGLSVDLVADGGVPTASVDVSAFINFNGVHDNCTAVNDIKTTLRIGNGSNGTPPTDTSLVFTCAQQGIQQIEVWVTDESGNSEFCLTYIDVQDNLNICPEQASTMNMIAGTIVTPTGEHVEHVMVNVQGIETSEMMTGDDGHFEFNDVPAGYSYTLIPEKNDDILNGVTTLDLILITKHILGVQLLDSPYKYLAADVNNSQNITTTDLIKLRKLVLHIDEEMPPGSSSWRFVSAGFVFPQPNNPWATEIPGLQNIENLTDDAMNIDFIGIKIGDVNNSATPNSLIGTEERSAYAEFGIAVENRAVKAGETVTIDFMARDMDKLAGFQFTMSFDPGALEFVSASSADLPSLDGNNFGSKAVEHGMLTASWNQMSETPDSKEIVLFSLTFTSNANAELQDLIFIDSRLTEAEAYTLDEDILDLGLVFLTSSTVDEGSGNELYQNRPNPFSDDTIIPFKLSETGEVSLNVYDLAGRLIYHMEGNYEGGYNEIVIGKDDLSVTGVMYYELRAGGWKDTRKMILTE